MPANIRNRLLIIAGLIALAIFYLYPRNQTFPYRGEDGAIRDTTYVAVPLKRGLDLQGGMHLRVELDETNRVSTDRSRDIELALTILRKRIDEFGVAEPVIQRVGDQIVVELAGISEPARARNVVLKNAFLEFRLTDRSEALAGLLPAMDRVLARLGVTAAGAGVTDAPAASQVDKLFGAADSAGAEEGDSAATPGGPILQQLIASAASLGFDYVPGEYAVPEAAWARVDSLLRIEDVAKLMPRNLQFLWSNSPTAIGTQQMRFLYVVEAEPIITGASLQSAMPQIDPQTGRPVVAFTLDRAGARRFGAFTGQHIGDFMAIVLDQQVQGRPPSIRNRIDRNGQIELGGRSIADAQDLSLTLNAGALPVPIKIVDQREVGPSLGADSIRKGIIAGAVGTLLVVIIMIGYYSFSGVLAVVGLGLYILFTLAGLAMIDATLTLPGLAGIVLSIGIAVDANVLIFERIREELALGKTTGLAVNEGFHRAMNPIVDANLTTVLVSLVLFQFGTGPVRGFAITLIIGTLASMVTAIFVTRTFFMIWLSKRDSSQPLSI